jgi:hypothetical protein
MDPAPTIVTAPVAEWQMPCHLPGQWMYVEFCIYDTNVISQWTSAERLVLA